MLLHNQTRLLLMGVFQLWWLMARTKVRHWPNVWAPAPPNYTPLLFRRWAAQVCGSVNVGNSLHVSQNSRPADIHWKPVRGLWFQVGKLYCVVTIVSISIEKAFFYTDTHTHTHTRTHARTHACTHARTHANTRTHTSSQARTHTHTAHTHTHWIKNKSESLISQF